MSASVTQCEQPASHGDDCSAVRVECHVCGWTSEYATQPQAIREAARHSHEPCAVCGSSDAAWEDGQDRPLCASCAQRRTNGRRWM